MPMVTRPDEHCFTKTNSALRGNVFSVVAIIFVVYQRSSCIFQLCTILSQGEKQNRFAGCKD